RPLLRRNAAGTGTADADLAVYRDQIAEIEAEAERGLLAGPEAVSAKTEVARRLIQRADEAKATASPAGPQQPGRGHHVAFYLAAGFVPLASLATYLALGSPQMPDDPLAARLNAPVNRANVDDLLAKVESVLRQHP